jgi:hypothetical protein
MSETSTLIGYGGRTIGREQLTVVPTPPATETHRPIPHHEIVQSFRWKPSGFATLESSMMNTRCRRTA